MSDFDDLEAMLAHDSDEVQLINAWLMSLSELAGWGVVLRFAFERFVHGRDAANSWLFTTAMRELGG